MLLYKYMPGPRFFSNFMFRFTPAEDLNDPKELVPDIRLRDPGAYAQDITRRNIERAYFSVLLSNPDFTPAEAWARCVAAAKQIEQQFDPIAKVRELYETFMRTTNRNVGVLSLTEDPCSAPMWAHYANEYKGLVIGLDSDSEFFLPKPEEPRVCGQLMNVLYTDTSPVVYVEPGQLDIPKEVFFTKARSWDYEKEWRIIKYLPQASEVADSPEGKKIHLFDVPPEAVKEVIFGSKISADMQEQVEQALQARAPHVLRKRVTFAPSDGLRVVDC
ncbi:DUF2971 domain-containing protein [Ralstonia solanacearum]|uniref:DUF2971 domain-containing protein n=1 Tax=Ralstonia solanacearum TaxID=305 RepID=A0AAD0S6E6_RALSL|nr:DUF2971 domain-containing protein [Ralstonia solanacearum]AXV80080.1 DUF2971 domain-containing protein [Ralstonia solanacearum]AXW51219.1 DUF2971 domain-containing protein [Ralstonia solanacearum]CBJ49385.1 hypothethical protein [Ralstonia solanacearum PSI07]